MRRYFGMMTVATTTAGSTHVVHIRVTESPFDTAHGWPRIDPAAFPDTSRQVLESLPIGEHVLSVIEPTYEQETSE